MIAALCLQAATAAIGSPPSQVTPPAPTRELTLNMQLDPAFIGRNDRDGDGRLGLAEFQDAMMRVFREKAAADPQARAKITPDMEGKMRDGMAPMFRVLDKNSNGRIEPTELKSGEADATPAKSG